MPRFSLKDLLITTALVAIGVTAASIPFTLDERAWRTIGPPELTLLAVGVLWIGGGTLAWVGLLLPFRHPWIGACIGVVTQCILLYAIVAYTIATRK